MLTKEQLNSWYTPRFPLSLSGLSRNVFDIRFKGEGKMFKSFINNLEVEFNDPHTEDYEESK